HRLLLEAHGFAAVAPVRSFLPHSTAYRTKHDDGGDGYEPCQEDEHDSKGAVQPVFGDERRREVERGEDREGHPEQAAYDGGPDELTPVHSSCEQEVHRPQEEHHHHHEAEKSSGHWPDRRSQGFVVSALRD